jgi:hypothetical protein
MAAADLSPDQAAQVERIFSVSHYSMGRRSGAWALDGLANILQPPAAPAPQAKPRKPKKPTLARLVAKAKQLGVDVTIEPDGAATFRTGSSTTAAADESPQTDVDEWIAKHAH